MEPFEPYMHDLPATDAGVASCDMIDTPDTDL
jgi:hypothetical protein